MSVGNGNAAAPQALEEAPLLRERRRSDTDADDGSLEALTNPRGRSHEEEGVEEDMDKANQHIGRVRTLLVILSLWGLIFLQGKLST
jgi:hypothetical protein